jgi:hypothetical protein
MAYVDIDLSDLPDKELYVAMGRDGKALFLIDLIDMTSEDLRLLILKHPKALDAGKVIEAFRNLADNLESQFTLPLPFDGGNKHANA